MTVPEGAAGPATAFQETPRATAPRLFLAALAALQVLWLPLAFLRQVDAFAAFSTTSDLLRDLSLAVLLMAVPALAFTGLALALGALPGLRRRHIVRWAVLLTPLAWLCLWQFGAASWAWAKLALHLDLTLTPRDRIVATVLLLTALLLLVRSGYFGQLLRGAASLLMALRGPSLLMSALAVAGLIAHTPRVLTAAPAPSRPAAADQPDVYLITIDTLSEMDAQVCSNGPTLMPRLREFANRSTCFQRHYSTANFTTPSTASLETGALPWRHWAVQIVAKMQPGLQGETLAARLRDAGYDTRSISANILASPRHHGSWPAYTEAALSPTTAWGAQPRFALSIFPDTTLPFWVAGLVPFLDTVDVYRHSDRQPYVAEYTYTPALEAVREARRPQFLWAHTLPPHDPFLPPPSTRYTLLPKGELDRWSQMLGMTAYAPAQQGLVDKHRLRYRESIMGADESLGRFLDSLQQQGKLESALVIITSDHGESFEHGYLGHAGEIMSESVLQVPLIIKLPGQTIGQRVSTPVSLADVAPTVLDLLSLPALPQADGRSLRVGLEGGTLAPRPVVAMALERQSRFQRLAQGQLALIDGPWKLHRDLTRGQHRLYRVDQDPHEQHDLAEAETAELARMNQLLDQALGQAEQRRAATFPTR